VNRQLLAAYLGGSTPCAAICAPTPRGQLRAGVSRPSTRDEDEDAAKVSCGSDSSSLGVLFELELMNGLS
jgi:hypothetical protein